MPHPASDHSIQGQTITGLILAGGAGSRVGGRDKGLIEWRGKPLAAHVAACLTPQVERLLISCNRNIETYQALGETVRDQRAGFQGPLAGIEAAASRVAPGVLVVAACDTPAIPGDLVARLLEGLGDSACEISYVHDGTREQYLCAAIRSECLASLTRFMADGGRAVRHWYQSRTCRAVSFAGQEEAFRNYNRGA